MLGGATLTKLLGTSAWYAPGASVAYLVDSILNDYKKLFHAPYFWMENIIWKIYVLESHALLVLMV